MRSLSNTQSATDLAGAPDFEILRRIVDVRRGVVADQLGRGLAAGLVGQVGELRAGLLFQNTVRTWSSRLEPVPPILNGGSAALAASANSFTVL